MIKTQVGKVKNNPIGAVAGAAASFWVAKKYGKVTNKWLLGGIAVAGIFVGANVQSMVKTQMNTPKASDTK